MMEKAKEIEVFESVPLAKAIRTLVIPTIISQLIMLVYNLADTWFIGQTGDDNQVAAVTLAFPVFMILSVISSMFGIGGGSLISRLLGKQEPENATKVFSFSVIGGVIGAALLSVLTAMLLPTLLSFLGADEFTYGYTRDYLMYTVVYGGIPSIMSMILANIIRAKGGAKIASFGLSMGGILNMIGDPIFIFGLHMDVAGAALSTAFSNCITMLFFIFYLMRTSSNSAFKIKLFAPLPSADLIQQIFSIGTPASLQILLAAVSNSIMMSLMGSYSSAAIAGLGVAIKVDQIPFYIVQGVSSGVLPLIAYNFASGNFKRMNKAISTSIKTGLAISFIGFFLIESLAPFAVQLFINTPDTVSLGAAFLRLRSLAMPVISVEFMLIAVFQGIGGARQAFVLSILRKGIVDIPLMYLLNAVWPMYGLMLVQPIMEFIGFTVALLLYRKTK